MAATSSTRQSPFNLLPQTPQNQRHQPPFSPPHRPPINQNPTRPAPKITPNPANPSHHDPCTTSSTPFQPPLTTIKTPPHLPMEIDPKSLVSVMKITSTPLANRNPNTPFFHRNRTNKTQPTEQPNHHLKPHNCQPPFSTLNQPYHTFTTIIFAYKTTSKTNETHRKSHQQTPTTPHKIRPKSVPKPTRKSVKIDNKNDPKRSNSPAKRAVHMHLIAQSVLISQFHFTLIWSSLFM